MTSRHMKRWLTSLIIREMQIKIAMRYHLISIWMVTLKKPTNSKCWQGCEEKGILVHSSALAWKIPWMEAPGGLQSMGSLGVWDDWATSLSLFTFMHWRGKWNPLQCSCLENPRDGGDWWAAVYGVAQSQTPMKQLSSSSKLLSDILFLLKELNISWNVS